MMDLVEQEASMHTSQLQDPMLISIDTMFLTFFVYIVSCKAFKLVQVVCSSAS